MYFKSRTTVYSIQFCLIKNKSCFETFKDLPLKTTKQLLKRNEIKVKNNRRMTEKSLFSEHFFFETLIVKKNSIIGLTFKAHKHRYKAFVCCFSPEIKFNQNTRKAI